STSSSRGGWPLCVDSWRTAISYRAVSRTGALGDRRQPGGEINHDSLAQSRVLSVPLRPWAWPAQYPGRTYRSWAKAPSESSDQEAQPRQHHEVSFDTLTCDRGSTVRVGAALALLLGAKGPVEINHELIDGSRAIDEHEERADDVVLERDHAVAQVGDR